MKRIAWISLAGCLLLAGCGGGMSAFSGNAGLIVSASSDKLDTGGSVRLSARLAAGGAAHGVKWAASVGSISANGVFTPPAFLTSDAVVARIDAEDDSGAVGTMELRVVPGFEQPLTPQNAALGAGRKTTISGVLAETGGTAGIRFRLEGTGSLSKPECERAKHGETKLTVCSVIYAAPATVATDTPMRVVAEAGDSTAVAHVLLRADGVVSNAAAHQARQMNAPVVLGSSGGNGADFDADGDKVADCCGGTLGALVQNDAGERFVLSNNHVLAMSDQARRDDAIVQPGLIDANCSSRNARPVAKLSAWVPLSGDVDAAVARVEPNAVNAQGEILELGTKQADGALSAAPLGVSSSGGRGEEPVLGMRVAKSGRTTGLTCGAVEAVALTVRVPYFKDCAETASYKTRVLSGQITASGEGFYDAGDSGSVLVDVANAEPLGMFFAGGQDARGVSHAVATPAPEVLNALSHVTGSLRYVGAEDHPVACLNFGAGTEDETELSTAEKNRVRRAVREARMMIGVVNVSAGKSRDRVGEGAVVVTVNAAKSVSVPAVIDGVRTVVVRANAELPGAALTVAMEAARRHAARLLAAHAEFFGVGAGQSLDDPYQAALVIYVERERAGRPAALPQVIAGLRVRYIALDRLHVTRGFSTNLPTPVPVLPKPNLCSR